MLILSLESFQRFASISVVLKQNCVACGNIPGRHVARACTASCECKKFLRLNQLKVFQLDNKMCIRVWMGLHRRQIKVVCKFFQIIDEYCIHVLLTRRLLTRKSTQFTYQIKNELTWRIITQRCLLGIRQMPKLYGSILFLLNNYNIQTRRQKQRKFFITHSYILKMLAVVYCSSRGSTGLSVNVQIAVGIWIWVQLRGHYLMDFFKWGTVFFVFKPASFHQFIAERYRIFNMNMKKKYVEQTFLRWKDPAWANDCLIQDEPTCPVVALMDTVCPRGWRSRIVKRRRTN
jgi:hypothetical protein